MTIARAVATRSPIIIFDDSTSALDAQTEAEVMRAIGVSVDGHDISSFDREQLRRKLGIVLRDTQLFMGTIKDNIRYGRMQQMKRQKRQPRWQMLIISSWDFQTSMKPLSPQTETA